MARCEVVFNMKNQHKDTHNAFVLTPFHSFNSFNSQIGTMENQHKDTPNTFVLTPFHSFNSFNSRFISLHFTPSTPLTPKKKQWKINIKRPFPTSW